MLPRVLYESLIYCVAELRDIIKIEMNNNKIERAAVRVVEEYIDKCPKLEPHITSNDKTPIWDGDIYIYKNESYCVGTFLYRVPLVSG